MAPSSGPSKRPGTCGSTSSNVNPSAGKSCEELLKATISSVHDVKMAKEFLERRCLVILGEEYDTHSLSMALLHLSQTTSLSKVLVDGLRAIALILEKLRIDNTASKIAETVTELLLPTTGQLVTTITDLQLTTDSLRSSSVCITRTADKFIDSTAASVQSMNDAAADITTATEEIDAAIKAQTQPSNPTPVAPTPLTYSYAAAVASRIHLPPTHATTLAQGDARARQVLIDKAPGTNVNGLEELTEKELVEKAKVAMEQLEHMDEFISTPVQFVGVHKL